jgi:hypothetical protein
VTWSMNILDIASFRKGCERNKQNLTPNDWFLDAASVRVIGPDFNDDLKTERFFGGENSSLSDTSSSNEINRKGILHVRF